MSHIFKPERAPPLSIQQYIVRLPTEPFKKISASTSAYSKILVSCATDFDASKLWKGRSGKEYGPKNPSSFSLLGCLSIIGKEQQMPSTGKSPQRTFHNFRASKSVLRLFLQFVLKAPKLWRLSQVHWRYSLKLDWESSFEFLIFYGKRRLNFETGSIFFAGCSFGK